MTVDVQRKMENYRDAKNLKSRISLYDYKTPRTDPVDIAAKLLPAELGLVLDVGCGFGRYVSRLRTDHPEATVVGIDAAAGMLTEVEPPIMVADAQAIPYPDDSADAILAMHMLYHVPDIRAAVAEFRRVLKPGGTLLVATNAHDDMAKMLDLWDRAIRSVPFPDSAYSGPEMRSFDSANARSYLETQFDNIEELANSGLVSVPEPGPILRFLASTQSFIGCDDAALEQMLDAAEAELADHFAANDRFEFEKTIVFYRCT